MNDLLSIVHQIKLSLSRHISTRVYRVFRFVLLVLCSFMLIPPAVQAAPEVSEELKELRAQIQLMMKRIDELEKQQEEKKDEPVIQTQVSEMPKEGKGVIELMSEKTTLTVGGRIQMDTYYDWGDDKDGNLSFSVRDTRFWLKSRTDTDYGVLSAILETDFGGSDGNQRTSNSHGLRIRHAYVQLGKIILGQTNSLFNSIAAPDVFAESIDDFFVRQPLMRWIEPFDGGHFAISFEQPETTLTNTAGHSITPDNDRFPDLVGRITWRGDWGETSVAALGRELRSDGAVVDGVKDEAYGGALSLTGKFLFFDYDDLRYSIAYGNGLGRYMAGNFFDVGSIDDQGRIQLMTAIGGHLSYRHWWNEVLRTTLAFAHIEIDNDSVVPDTTNKLGQSFNANLIWIPFENSQLGIEYMYQRTELESGQSTDLSRLQFRAMYEF